MLSRCAMLSLMAPLLAACGAGEASQVAKRGLRLDEVSQVELLQDGSFEDIRPGGSWSAFEDGFQRDPNGRTGEWGVRCNGDGEKRLGIHQRIEFTVPVDRPLLVSGWSRAEDAGAGGASDYSVYVDIIYDDGTPLWGQIAPFDNGTHDWQYREKLILPVKPVKSVEVYALFRSHKGTVWFDDFSLRQIQLPSGAVSFDGASVVEDIPLPMEDGRTTLSAGADLVLALGRRSGAAHVTRAWGSVKPSNASSGFLLRDVGADSDFYAPTVKIGPANGEAHGDGRVAELGLQLTANYLICDDWIQIDADVRDLTGEDRAVSVYFALPIDAAGWTWWDDIRTGRQIEPGQEYKHTVSDNVGAVGQHSLYPFSCISSDDAAICIATPLNAPRITRTVYDARSQQLYVVFDLALTPDTTRFPSRADFRFILYTCDPAWGFRAAAKKYYGIYPEFFVNRTPEQGLWMPFEDIANVPNAEDFCFAFQEGAPNSKWDDEHGVLSFTYIEPMSFWQPLAPEIPRTYEACITELERNKREGDDSRKRMAWATEFCGVKDREGKLQLDILDTPWCDGCVFGLNASPEVQTDGEHENKAQINISSVLRHIERAKENGGDIDGTYLDSLEGWGWQRNFRREHFAVATIPLTFTIDTREPVLLNIFSTYEFTRAIEREMRQRGKLMMANSVPSRWAFFAHLLDVMGTETNWNWNGQWSPMAHSDLAFRRTMCYQRPYCLLQNTAFKDFGPDLVEKYMQRSLFYGVHPGFFSVDASTDTYFGNPAYYERDRDVVRKYVRIIKEVAEAGWEPVTYATSSDPEVWVERFGPSATGQVYFAVTAVGHESRAVEIVIDSAVLGLPKLIGATEMVSGRPMRARDGKFEVLLQPEQVIALRCEGATM